MILAAAVVCSGDGGDKESCLRFGGGACCPILNAIDRPIQEVLCYFSLITERGFNKFHHFKTDFNSHKSYLQTTYHVTIHDIIL